MIIRPATPHDVASVVALIDSVYREYGDRIFLQGADADLLEIDACYRTNGGEFIVLEVAGLIRGTHAVLPVAGQPGVCTFRRLYLEPSMRGADVGKQLMRWAVEWGLNHALDRVAFWSDTRFTRAHRFFEKCGLSKTGETREMNDGVAPYREFFFHGDLSQIIAQGFL